MPDHLDVCPEKIVECSYSKVGCTEKMARKNYKNHCQTSQERHMLLLLEDSEKKMNKLKN